MATKRVTKKEMTSWVNEMCCPCDYWDGAKETCVFPGPPSINGAMEELCQEVRAAIIRLIRRAK